MDGAAQGQVTHRGGREHSKNSKGSDGGDNGVINGKMKKVRGGVMRGGKTKLVLGGLILICIAGWVLFFGSPLGGSNESASPSHSVGWMDTQFYLRLGFQKLSYAVVIDAGSTGTRVLAFQFHQTVSDKNLKLKDEIFVEVKPGLSSFAEDPAGAAKSVESLLQKAREFIPRESWAATPIALKATAGLRLLPKSKADGILAAVEDVVGTSGFAATKDSVGIMDGVDEGIFSWFTVNFLLDRIGGEVSKTVAALDLGGGSTQITVASSKTTVGFLPAEDIHNVSLFHQNVPLYTHSYLGLGLQAVRKAVLAANATDESQTTLVSACVNPAVSREWTYGGVTYTIKGAPSGKFEKVQYNGFARREAVADWEACHSLIVSLIEEKRVIKPKDLNRQVVLISYFFERAAEAGLVDPLEGGKVSVSSYLDAGKAACSVVNVDLPLLCLDLTFMGAMLHNGYGIPNATPLLALKKLHGHELSWALGAAYHLLQNS